MIDRRSLIRAFGATAAAGGLGLAPASADAPVFAGCRMDGGDHASLALFDIEGRELFSTALPSRGHDVSLSPDGRTLVAFARRPGTWFAVIDRAGGTVLQTVHAAPGKHFYGHGVFVEGGRLMLATENDVADGDGILGIYDVRDGWRRLGELPSRGVGPHDIAEMPGGLGTAVANGGIRTHPDTGRDILNLDSMRPNLAILDREGKPTDIHELGPEYRLSSLRHIAVAADGTVGFGCQFEGPAEDAPALVGMLTPTGRIELLPIDDDANARFDNYIGSVAFDRSGTILAATSPRGGVVGYWDVRSRRFLGQQRLPDVCGVAAAPAASVFVITSGNAGVRIAEAGTRDLRRFGGTALDRWMWDNHLIPL